VYCLVFLLLIALCRCSRFGSLFCGVGLFVLRPESGFGVLRFRLSAFVVWYYFTLSCFCFLCYRFWFCCCVCSSVGLGVLFFAIFVLVVGCFFLFCCGVGVLCVRCSAVAVLCCVCLSVVRFSL